MKKLSKLIFPLILIAVILFFYFTYFAPTKELGSFSKFSSGAEINQTINVQVDKSMKFEKDANGNITSFYAKDKNNIEIVVTSHEPILPKIASADIVELLGHMHENSFIAAKIAIIK